MPNETQTQDQATEQDQAEKTPVSNEKEIAEKYEAKFKGEIKGLNQAISAMKKQNDELLAKTLSTEELAQKKISDSLNEAEQAKKEAFDYKKSLWADRALSEAGLPLTLANRVQGLTEDEIKNDVKVLSDFINSEIAKKVSEEVRTKLAGAPPTGGTPVSEMSLQTAYDNAKKAGDFALVNAIQREATKSGVAIKN